MIDGWSKLRYFLLLQSKHSFIREICVVEMQKIVTINGNFLILVVSQQQLAFLEKKMFSSVEIKTSF
jgi:hypothetical protein